MGTKEQDLTANRGHEKGFINEVGGSIHTQGNGGPMGGGGHEVVPHESSLGQTEEEQLVERVSFLDHTVSAGEDGRQGGITESPDGSEKVSTAGRGDPRDRREREDGQERAMVTQRVCNNQTQNKQKTREPVRAVSAEMRHVERA